MIDLGLPGYSRPSSRVTSRATSRANSRSPSPDGTMSVISCATDFTDQSCASNFTLQFNTQRGRERPDSLSMNYQTRDNAKINLNDKNDNIYINGENRVLMNSMKLMSPSEKYKELLKTQKRQKNMLRQRKLETTKIVPPDVKTPIKFSDNPKNKNYTMERMPILDNSKKGFTFDPKLPKDYIRSKNKVVKSGKTKQLALIKEKKKDLIKKEPSGSEIVYSDTPDLIFTNNPDEIVNKTSVKISPNDFIPSWNRNK